ncbi:glycosyltransferase family 4 protein [Pseudarthrobacter scleromae]|uniref:glycosyltransferase family 4 protein n=1 Tax=Pseudarthrobacter scleromae TaxID=158897 RepID=UPI003CFDEA6E
MFFEQIALPLKTFGQKLISLGGPAPIAKLNQVVVLFDASVFRYPSTFSFAFRLWYKIMYFVLSRTARRLVTISDFSALEISSVLGISKSRFAVATCGADHAEKVKSESPGLSLPERFVVCIGTIAPRKNLIPVIQALSSRGIKTVVVGAVGNPRVFSAAQSSLNLENLTFAGRLSDSEVTWLLERAEALVFPSLYEGFGLPLLEAQVAGCPVVSSNAASMPEVLRDSGLLFDPKDPEAAVAQVMRIIDDRGLREKLVKAGKENVARYRWADTARTILAAAKL